MLRWCLPVLLLMLPLASAVGYAPIGVLGHVSYHDAPLGGASVVVRGLSGNDTVMVADPVLTRDDGSFFSLLTVPDPSVVVIEVLISYDGDSYVELVSGASSWGHYELSFDIAGDELRSRVPPSPSSATADAFEGDLEAIRQGEALVNDSLVEKYGIEVSRRPVPSARAPAVEEPSPVVVAPADEGLSPGFFEIVAVAALLLLVVFVRYELLRHS